MDPGPKYLCFSQLVVAPKARLVGVTISTSRPHLGVPGEWSHLLLSPVPTSGSCLVLQGLVSRLLSFQSRFMKPLALPTQS